jgi:heme/copper-type cytochrome/quinol oxidase subunit 1
LIYLARDGVDLPGPEWEQLPRPQYETEALVFVIARIIFVSAQLLFLMNLAWSYFFGREIQTQNP